MRPRRAFLLAVLLLGACVFPGSRSGRSGREHAAPEPIQITLVGTNDIHGWIYPRRSTLPDGTELSQGGLAVFAGYLSVLRQKNPGGTLLLDAGDMLQGTLASDFTEGAVVIDAMNHLGYTAAALGNREFDYGPVGPSPVASLPGQDPFEALKARIKQARFPILASNVADEVTGRRPDWLEGTFLLDVRGLRVGIIGLTTPSTPNVTNPVNVQTLRFGALAPEAHSAARSLRERGAELVFAVVHAGGKCGSWNDPGDLSSCDVENGEIFEMLDSMPPRTLDAVVAGHTHAPLGHFINGTPVIGSWSMGRQFAIIELAVDAVKHRVLEARTRIVTDIPICTLVDRRTQTCDPRELGDRTDVALVPATFLGEPIRPDEEVTRLIAPTLARVAELHGRPLGITLQAPLTRHYEAESSLGTALADALRERERADVAILNPGSLRADLPAGPLRYGDFYEALPSASSVATLTITGEELRRLLIAAYGARKGVFQISGLRVELSSCPGETRLRTYTLEDGRPVPPDREYKVVMSDFLARGGDGLRSVMASLKPESIDLGTRRADDLRAVIIAHWKTRRGPLVPPRLGRVQIVGDLAGCKPGEALDIQARP